MKTFLRQYFASNGPCKNTRTFLRQYIAWEEALGKYVNFLKTIFFFSVEYEDSGPRFTIIIIFFFVLMTAIAGAVGFGVVCQYTLQALGKIQNL